MNEFQTENRVSSNFRTFSNFDEESETIAVEEHKLPQGKKIQTLYTNSYRYVGETDNLGKRNGFGICEYRNNNKYIGQFLEGKLHGIGKIILQNGDIFQGEFSDGEINGFLEQIVGNEVKQGIAKNSSFAEDGVILYMRKNPLSKSNYIEVEGVFDMENELTGIGQLVCKEKNLSYEGELSNFCSNGWGIASIKEKFIYKGFHKEGKFDGYGETYFPDGSKFFGFFKENIKSGLSIAFSTESKVTFGSYLNDYKQGPSVIYYKNLFAVELFHHGFRSRVFERYESAKTYFKTYYPEYDWVARINMKKIIEYFTEIKAEEYLMPAVPEVSKEGEKEKTTENVKNCKNAQNGVNNVIVFNEKKEVSFIAKIRETMKRDMDSA
jgi:hypothetical protein